MGKSKILKRKLSQYKLIILPEITNLSDEAINVIKRVCEQGTNLIATNRSFSRNPEALLQLFGAKIVNKDHPGDGFYLNPQEKQLFKTIRQTDIVVLEI